MSTRARLLSNVAHVAIVSSENQESECEEENHEEDSDDGSSVRGWSPAKKSRKSRYVCRGGQKVCGLSISSKDDSIMCDSCKNWFHPKCQGLTVDAFKALSKYDFLWLCIHCKPKFMALLEIGKGIEARIETAEKKIIESFKEAKGKDHQKQLEEKIQQMEKSVSQIKEQQTKLGSSMNEQSKAVQAVPKYTEELKNSAQEIRKFVESQDREGRENNIIVHNIPESSSADPSARRQHDTEMFQGLVKALLGSEKVDTTQVYRLGKRHVSQEQAAPSVGKPRLLMIKLKEKEHVSQLIRRRTQLKEVGYPNIYLTKDLSPDERAAQKRLRDELQQKGKETHKIFRGRVVPRV